MKINFTKKEYRLLLEMLYLSDWMMHAHSIDHSEHSCEHEALMQRVLSFYKEMGAEDIVEPAENSNKYYEKREFEESLHHNYIDPYEENTFWEELIERLASRDAINAIGLEKFKAMEGIERSMKVDEFRKYYAKEFEQNGLENIKISDSDLGTKPELLQTNTVEN